MFTFRIEREADGGGEDDGYLDPFMEDTETSSSASTPVPEDHGMDGDQNHAGRERARGRSESLSEARDFRSRLKDKLLQALRRRHGARRCRHMRRY
jgi:hypothetical protein